MIRAFIAVEIDPQTVRQISAVVGDLKPRIPGIRWVRPTNFHLTLKFLGDIEESKIEPIVQALQAALYPFPSSPTHSTRGRFKSGNTPKSLAFMVKRGKG